MPDNPSPFDDPLADLYGKLPDPHRASSSSPSGGVPASRREARAARESGDDAAAADSAAPVPAPASTDASTPAATEAPAPAATEAPAPAASEALAPAASDAPGPTAPAEPRHAPRAGAPRRHGAPGATLDDLFTGERSLEEVGTVPPKKSKRRRRAGGWIAFGIVLALVGGVAAGGIWAWNEFGTRIQEFFADPTVDDYEAGLANGETEITIVSGDTGTQVSQKVFDAGVTKTSTSLYDYMIQESIDFPFQPGVFRLQLQMTSPAVLEALANPENRLENTALLREGLTVESSLSAISEQMGIPLEELQSAVADPSVYGVSAQSLEGWLFPATYTFGSGATATDIIQTLVNRTVQSLDAAGVPVEERQRILTVASIIEREGRTPDFGKVSRVIQNRLDQGMLLQMDSTAQYGYGELHAGSASTSEEAQFDDNPWNTYVIEGLPATPIANPGDAAIAAAMNPEDGPWLFFVTVNLDTGETVFTTTADEHQTAVNQWIQWCRDNPDSGC